MRSQTLADRFTGAPFALPRPLDRLSERWWSLSPRWRFAGIVFVGCLVAIGGLAHVAATPYGPPTSVLVAVRDLPIGHHLTPADLRRTDWPETLVPDGALQRAEGQLASLLPAGAVATDRHVAVDGIAGALPPGSAAVAVPLDALPALTVGARLDIIGRDLDGRAQVLASGADVITLDADDAWLAVDAHAAADVAAATASGVITVVLVSR